MTNNNILLRSMFGVKIFLIQTFDYGLKTLQTFYFFERKSQNLTKQLVVTIIHFVAYLMHMQINLNHLFLDTGRTIGCQKNHKNIDFKKIIYDIIS